MTWRQLAWGEELWDHDDTCACSFLDGSLLLLWFPWDLRSRAGPLAALGGGPSWTWPMWEPHGEDSGHSSRENGSYVVRAATWAKWLCSEQMLLWPAPERKNWVSLGCCESHVLWGSSEFSRGAQIYRPRALRFTNKFHVLLREFSFNASDNLLRVLWSSWPRSPGVAVIGTALLSEGGLMTWTRKKSSAGLQFCFIHVNGFNPTMTRKFGFLWRDCSLSWTQKSWTPNEVDSLRSKAHGWPESEIWVTGVPRVTEGTSASAFPLLPPLLTPFEDNLMPPSPACGEGEEHPPWVGGLCSAHHLQVQQKHYSTLSQILVVEREEPSASSQAFWLKTPTCTRQQWRLLVPDNLFLSPLVPFSLFLIQ